MTASFAAALCWLPLAQAAAPPAFDPRLEQDEAGRVALLRRVAPSVVAVFGPESAGGGSGVLISPDGFALTNFHVVNGSGPAVKCGLNDGQLYDAAVVGIDPVGDLALIKLLGRDDFPAAALGDSDKLAVGAPAYALGNPFLLATDFAPTVTVGIVSGVHRYQPPAGTLLEYADCIQTDASINPGNSGGPLFNAAGELVGINGRASFEKRGRVNVGVAYAISINQVKNFLDHLRGGWLVDHATLGATVRTSEDGRVLVDDVLAGSDAYLQGLRPGDEIAAVGGRPVATANAFKNALGIYPKGWRVELAVRRDGERLTMHPRLRGIHRDGELGNAGPRRAPPTPRPGPPGRPPGPPPGQPPQGQRIRLPASVAAVFRSKPGFVNYYFNELERDRLLAGLRLKGPSAAAKGRWRILLQGPAGPAEVLLADKALAWRSGGQEYIVEPGPEKSLDPPGSGGLLLALGQWRRLLRDGAAGFRQCEFAGGVPDLAGVALPALRTEQDAVQAFWRCRRDTGLLASCECDALPDALPCLVAFDDYRPAAGALFPHRWTVQQLGGKPVVYTVQQWEVSP